MIPFQNLLDEKQPFLGSFIQSAAPEFVEASAYAGFRFAAIDLEHTYYGVEKLAELIRAGEAVGLSMLARVLALDAIWLKKSLDLGAAGVIIPNVDTAEQAAEAVRLCKFISQGIRGACPGVRANRYGAGGSEYYERANRETVVISGAKRAPQKHPAEGLVQKTFCGIFQLWFPGFLGPYFLPARPAAPLPATRPKTTKSHTALPPMRLPPCTPPVTSPAA